MTSTTTTTTTPTVSTIITTFIRLIDWTGSMSLSLFFSVFLFSLSFCLDLILRVERNKKEKSRDWGKQLTKKKGKVWMKK